MCPACVATAALVSTGVVSTGGITALLARLFGRKKKFGKVPESDSSKEKSK